jgi:thiol-disulfide isomerase/thioredoxin
MMMKRMLAAAFVGLGTLTTAASAVTVGEALPGTRLQHVKEGALDNAAMTGKVVVINFWATWCAACKVELVEMEDQLKPLLGEKDLNVAFVSLDKDPAKAVEWFQGNLKDPDLFLRHLYADAAFEVADKLKVDAFPMTIVIDRDGKIVHVQRGFKEGEGSTEQIVKLSEKLLKQIAH